MKIKHLPVAWVAVGLLFTACGKKENPPPTRLESAPAVSEKTPATEELHWLTDFEAAKAQARSEDKMLLMLFTGSDWCPPCKMLDEAVFSKPEFVQYAADHLVSLEVDFPRRKPISLERRAANGQLAGAYGVEGFPTVIVLDPGSKPLGKFGYVPGLEAKKVIEVLEKARTGK